MIGTVVLPIEQKFFSMQELKDIGFSLYKIGKMVSSGKLVKLNKGCYENTAYSGEESDFYYVTAYVPQGVICLMSAAAYYGLTTYIPSEIDVAIPRKAKVSTLPDWPEVSIHYFTDNRHGLGAETIWEGRNRFKIYNIEKTVVDIVFYREDVGIEETKEILTAYLQRSERNLNKLLKYARLLKCDKVLRGYLEVLI